MNRNYLFTVVFGVVAVTGLSACKREATPAPEATPVAAPAPVDATTPDATAVAENTPAPAGVATDAFDVKGFAGRFSAQGVALDLHADGTFALEQAGSSVLSGTWTLEDDGRHILLDPNSKAEQDRRYQMLGKDELQLAGDAGAKLRREGT